MKNRNKENSNKSRRMATLENVVMEEDEAGNNAKEEDELPDDVLRMSTDELISRTRLLDNEVGNFLILIQFVELNVGRQFLK